MKHFFAVLLLHALRVSASLVTRRNAPAPYITSDEVRHCENLYRVRLQDGYTLEDHFETLGVDLRQNTTMFYSMASINAYHARIDPYIVHELIRYDPRVVSVLHDYYDDGGPGALNGEAVESTLGEETGTLEKETEPPQENEKQVNLRL